MAIFTHLPVASLELDEKVLVDRAKVTAGIEIKIATMPAVKAFFMLIMSFWCVYVELILYIINEYFCLLLL